MMMSSSLINLIAGGGDAEQPGAEQPAGEPVLEDLERLQAEEAGTCRALPPWEGVHMLCFFFRSPPGFSVFT